MGFGAYFVVVDGVEFLVTPEFENTGGDWLNALDIASNKAAISLPG